MEAVPLSAEALVPASSPCSISTALAASTTMPTDMTAQLLNLILEWWSADFWHVLASFQQCGLWVQIHTKGLLVNTYGTLPCHYPEMYTSFLTSLQYSPFLC